MSSSEKGTAIPHVIIDGNVSRRVVSLVIPGHCRIEFDLEYSAKLRATLLECEQKIASGGVLQ